jgi:hypothetical protein
MVGQPLVQALALGKGQKYSFKEYTDYKGMSGRFALPTYDAVG